MPAIETKMLVTVFFLILGAIFIYKGYRIVEENLSRGIVIFVFSYIFAFATHPPEELLVTGLEAFGVAGLIFYFLALLIYRRRLEQTKQSQQSNPLTLPCQNGEFKIEIASTAGHPRNAAEHRELAKLFVAIHKAAREIDPTAVMKQIKVKLNRAEK